MSESKTFQGGCHCGKVSYEVTADLSQVISCNCSICSKKGYLLSFVPESAFRLQKGEGELTDYQFNKHVIHHTFCRSCGIESFARGKGPDGTPMVAVNVHCLDGIDLASLTVTPFNGKDM